MFRRSLVSACLLLIPLAAASPLPPSPPQDLWFDEGDSSLTFEWSPPVFDGGAPVQGYTVHRVLNGEPLAPVDVTDTSFTQGGLDPSDIVLVYVNAYNAAGAGPASDPALRGPIPRCSAFGFTIDPPNHRLRPECLLPG